MRSSKWTMGCLYLLATSCAPTVTPLDSQTTSDSGSSQDGSLATDSAQGDARTPDDAGADARTTTTVCGECAQLLCTSADVTCAESETCRSALRCLNTCSPTDTACAENCATGAGLTLTQLRASSECFQRTDRCRLACSASPPGGTCQQGGYACIANGPSQFGCCGDFQCRPPESGAPEYSTWLCTHDVGGTCDTTLPNPNAQCRFPARCNRTTAKCELLCWSNTDICFEGASCCTPGAVCPMPGFTSCCMPDGAIVPNGANCCSNATETTPQGRRCVPRM